MKKTFIGLIAYCSYIYPSLQNILIHDLLLKYERPITLLYVSKNPQKLSIAQKHSVIIWSDQPDLENYLRRENYSNHILLTGEITRENMSVLADCEHFDVAILDIDFDLNFLCNKIHLADQTIIVSARQSKVLKAVGEDQAKNLYLICKPKTVLKKNWWKSISFHKNYRIESNFKEKYFVKPADYTVDKKEKKYRWRIGINLLTYHHLGGVYPPKAYVREEIIGIFNPLTHADFGAGNIIIQGKSLKAIDYDDTIYSEDPYERLRRTLENQLGLKYK